MNIFFLNSIGVNTWGGGEKWMLTTAMGLRERGHKIYFSGRKNSVFLQKCQEQAFDVFPLNIKSDFGLWNIGKLANFFLKNEIDIVVANFNKDVRLAGFASKLSNKPVVIARNGLPIIPNNQRYKFTYRLFADSILTNSEAIKNKYLSYGWMKDDFVKVIHNGIQTDQDIWFNRSEILAKYRLPQNGPIIGIFGRLVQQKQHWLFLEVAKKILDKISKATFLIVGDGPLRDDIEKYAIKLKIENNVRFVGFNSQVMELYSICDLVLLTSENEGLPNAVMEAMLAGKPVVAFDVGGVKELIYSEEVGVVVTPGDVDAMFRKVVYLLNNRDLMIEMGQKARNYIINNFSLNSMLNDLESYFKMLLINKKRVYSNLKILI